MSSYLSEQAARFCFPHWLEFNEQLCTDISHQCPYFTREFKSRQIKNKCNISVSGPVSEIARPDWSLNYKPFWGFFLITKEKIKRRCGDVIVKKFRNAAIYLTAESETLMLPQTVQPSSTNTYKKKWKKWIITSFFYQIIKPHGSACDPRAEWLQLQENKELPSLLLTLWLWCWRQCCGDVCLSGCIFLHVVCVCVVDLYLASAVQWCMINNRSLQISLSLIRCIWYI